MAASCVCIPIPAKCMQYFPRRCYVGAFHLIVRFLFSYFSHVHRLLLLFKKKRILDIHLLNCLFFQFLRLGFNGYAKIMKNLSVIKKRLATQIEATGQQISTFSSSDSGATVAHTSALHWINAPVPCCRNISAPLCDCWNQHFTSHHWKGYLHFSKLFDMFELMYRTFWNTLQRHWCTSGGIPA